MTSKKLNPMTPFVKASQHQDSQPDDAPKQPAKPHKKAQEPKTTASKAAARAAKKVPPEPAKPARGRPPKYSDKDEMTSTTLRLTVDDHIKLNELRARDRISLNDLVYKALQEYCLKRGKRLTGRGEAGK